MAKQGLNSGYVNTFDALLDSDSDSEIETVNNVEKTIENNFDNSENSDDKKDVFKGRTERKGKQDTDKYMPPSSFGMNSNSWSVSKKKKRKDKEQLKTFEEGMTYKGDNFELNDMWKIYTHINSNNDWGIDSYDPIQEIKSVGDMWRFLNIMDNLNKDEYQYFVMRKDITPIWEDNKNKSGGICSIAIKNRYDHNYEGNLGICAFIAICALVMNETFVTNNTDINGLSFSIKSRNVLIKLWVADYHRNENFPDRLPLTLLKKLEEIITKSSNRYRNDRMAVSVQYKEIKPDY